MGQSTKSSCISDVGAFSNITWKGGRGFLLFMLCILCAFYKPLSFCGINAVAFFFFFLQAFPKHHGFT